ncbi:FadR/GntR family transcriptional regulator [Sphingomonas sp.]|uniref:FadR/GntR family transcriptional regulator n=1 Tax=Sphingomonas sp. TaxID=28214 RepID=UPI002DD627F1|nr:FadR/GntR family transcriptional regulator [Sphingomonas sp.]
MSVPTKAASLADDLVIQFVSEIESGRMRAGARFPTEKDLTERFGVSRTVVREAFARLAAQGLLESRRGSGAYVPANAQYRAFQVVPEDLVAIEDVLRLLEMRMALETEMAGLAAERRDDAQVAILRALVAEMDASDDLDSSMAIDTRFHAAIAGATGNAYFVRFTDFLGIRLVPPRRLYLDGVGAMTPRDYARTINAEHRAICEAIADRDTEAARDAARRHMDTSYRRHMAMREKYRDAGT